MQLLDALELHVVAVELDPGAHLAELQHRRDAVGLLEAHVGDVRRARSGRGRGWRASTGSAPCRGCRGSRAARHRRRAVVVHRDRMPVLARTASARRRSAARQHRRLRDARDRRPGCGTSRWRDGARTPPARTSAEPMSGGSTMSVAIRPLARRRRGTPASPREPSTCSPNWRIISTVSSRYPRSLSSPSISIDRRLLRERRQHQQPRDPLRQHPVDPDPAPARAAPGYTVTGRLWPSYSSSTPIRFSARSSGPIGRRRK